MDFTKHSILVYNNNSDYYDDTDTVFNTFKVTLNKIVDAFFTVNNVYPKMNLIGHSRGTVINLKYATEYPDRIDSMFALGGIFGNPVLANVLESSLVTGILNLLPATSGGWIRDMHDSEFVRDIALVNDVDFFVDLQNEWNTNTTGKDIKAYAITSVMNGGFLKKMLEETDELSGEEKALLKNLAVNLQLQAVANISDEQIARLIYSFFSARSELDLSESELNGITSAYSSVYGYVLNEVPVWMSDGFLEESVQSAEGYNHFSVYERCFGKEADLTKKSQSGLEIPHNLEARDRDIIQFIISNIDVGQTRFLYTEGANNTVTIDTIIAGTVDTSIAIPATIDGKTVVRIGGYAGAGNLHKPTNSLYPVTSITIPNTVTEIGFGAFQDCTNLTNVTFASGSQLTTIRPYVFAGCTSLTGVTLPDSVTTVYEYAFAGCTSLASFNLKNVSTLAGGAFADCTSLTTFTKNSSNGALVIANGRAVYNAGQTTLLAYAVGNTATTLSLPTTVTIIDEAVCKGASYLTGVTFPNALTTIGHHAFDGCYQLASIVIHGNCTVIGWYAFFGCNALSDVTMYSTGNIEISECAFAGLPSGRVIKVPNSALQSYKNKIPEYQSDIVPVTFSISYVTYNGTTLDPTTVYYGEVPHIVDKNTLTRVGYAIDGWYTSTTGTNGTGTVFNELAAYTTKGNTTVYAKWVEMSVGNIMYQGNGATSGTMNGSNVLYGETFTLPACEFQKTAYDFAGWATSPTGAVVYRSGQSYVFTLTETLTLYAKWSATQYSITYDYNGATSGYGNLPTYYTVENHVTFTTGIQKTGFTFYGWVLVGDADGLVLASTQGYASALQIRAEWLQVYANASSAPTTITSTAVELNFSSYASGASVNKVFTFSNLVDSITIKNANNLKSLAFNIDNSRSYPINVILDNASYTAGDTWQGIRGISVDIKLYVKSTSSITGGASHYDVTSFTLPEIGNLFLLASGITCKNMWIYRHPDVSTVPTLTIRGGNGINGTNGQAGSAGGNNQNGSNATNGTNGCTGANGVYGSKLTIGANVRLYCYGGNGGKGGNGGAGGAGGNRTTTVGYGVVGLTGTTGGKGGNGGNGGSGGNGLWLLSKLTFEGNGSLVTVVAGNGGNGGNGGKGGKGGKGGPGGDGKFGVHAAKGGKGGTGGQGGNSGVYGGAPAGIYVVTGQIVGGASVTNTSGSSGTNGTIGSGGQGGAGGQGGKKWPTGNYAETGDTGATGASGSVGS